MDKNTTQAIQLAEEKANELAEVARFKVNSGPTFEKAGQILKDIKSYKSFVSEKKDGIVKPLNEALKNIKELFKPVETKIDLIESYMKGEILSYNKKLQAEMKKREEEAMAKIEAGESIDTATKSMARVEEKISSIPTRKVKRLKINNINLINRQYLVPDEAKIKTDLLAGLKVEGCELIEEEIVVNSFK